MLHTARINSFTGFTAAGWLSLSKAKKLTTVELINMNVGAEGLANLGKCRSLEHLEISDFPATDEDLQPIRTMKQLRTLKLNSTKATVAFIASLKAALPKVTISVGGKRP